MMRSNFRIFIIYVVFSSSLSIVRAGLLDMLGGELGDQRRGRGFDSNLGIRQILNGNNKPYNPYPNNNYNRGPHPTRPDNQGLSNKEQLENLKDRLEKLNHALEEKNKQKNNNDNTNNDNSNNDNSNNDNSNNGNSNNDNSNNDNMNNHNSNNHHINNFTNKPSKNDNTNDWNNGNADDNNNGNNNSNNNIVHNNNNVINKKHWNKLTKDKFYFQAQPVVPEDELDSLHETVYYNN